MMGKRFLVFLLAGMVFVGCEKKPTPYLRNGDASLEEYRHKVTSPVKPVEQGWRGLVKIYEGNPTVYFILNWTTRSQRAFEVVNADKINLRQYAGKILTVKVEVIEEQPYSGKIRIIEILKIETEEQMK